jgi:hypothetical protein
MCVHARDGRNEGGKAFFFFKFNSQILKALSLIDFSL